MDPFQRKDVEFETPSKKIISDGDLLIANLLQNQQNKCTTLKKELNTKKEFIKGSEYIPIDSYCSGKTSLENFQNKTKHIQDIANLKRKGLSNEEIELYFKRQKGLEYVLDQHKILDVNHIKARLNDIDNKLNSSPKTENTKETKSRLATETMLSLKPNSLKTNLLKFALSNETKVTENIPSCIDNIKQLEEEFMSNIDTESHQNIKKIRKRIRNKVKAIEEMSIELNKPSFKIRKVEYAADSKWDIKEQVDSVTQKPPNSFKNKKTYSCQNKQYYTIRNGKIEPVNLETDKTESCNQTKLSVDEIKKLPHFLNYDVGVPSNILYLKNLSHVSEDDLKEVFKNFCNDILEFKIMKGGKMRGQAFIKFVSVEKAGLALNSINGIYIKNKPVIISYSRIKT